VSRAKDWGVSTVRIRTLRAHDAAVAGTDEEV
jgi:hypothetical protein